MPTIRLLIPAGHPPQSGSLSFELLGRCWEVVEKPLLPGDTGNPDYTCISYAWGPDRVDHPLGGHPPMSSRTLPVLEAVLGVFPMEAIWIDALCVPPQGPVRAACLQSMGAIYGAAKQVCVVLSPACAAALEQMRDAQRIEESVLPALDGDEWVTRAWTYQEIVNSKKVLFLAEGGSQAAVDGERMLNCVGKAISDYKKAHGKDSFRPTFRQVDHFESVLGDWRIAGFLERSAYQVLAAMQGRMMAGVAGEAGDSFDAMVGTLEAAPIREPDLHPAEHFMRISEGKGDFSFIYSAASRHGTARQGWRPEPGALAAVLPWDSFGPGQSGQVHPAHLQLHAMCIMHPGTANPAAREWVEQWLSLDANAARDRSLRPWILAWLEEMGFAGSGDCLEQESGYFFPAMPFAGKGITAVVATQVRWTFGGPGLLVREEESGLYRCLGAGAFVGPVPRDGHSINIC